MLNRLGSRVALILAAFWLGIAPLPAAWALQATAEIEESTPWRQWIATVLMFGLCVVVFFKNAKRTHQN